MALFTPEELAALRQIDEEIEEDFHLTNEDLRRSRQLDREAQLNAMDPEQRKRSTQQKAYREANKEKVAARQKAYYEANREKRNQYMRQYMRQYRQRRKAAAT